MCVVVGALGKAWQCCGSEFFHVVDGKMKTDVIFVHSIINVSKLSNSNHRPLFEAILPTSQRNTFHK